MRKGPTMSSATRVTVTLTKDQDTVLRTLADRHKVSVAWLVRNALDRIVAGDVDLAFPAGAKR